jgi:hypothetical protein
MSNRIDRPNFFPLQFLGAADMETMVGYARLLAREHSLAAHSWGIATGLELAEVPSEDGGSGVDLFVLPGFAWDGYGRPIALLTPVQVPLELFAGLPSGNQQIWIRYSETPFRGLREGFETCGADEAYARIRESFALEVGGFTSVRDRQGGLSYAGIAVDDARLAARALTDTAPLMCDASVPHQAFPADTARWLIPLGVANWVNGAPGSLQPRSTDTLKLNRTLRQMAGAVAENLFASDGVIRLRDRFTQFKDGDAPDQICNADRITVDDLMNEPDRDDSMATTDRLVGNELVWVEGNMRATGQVRLFGTRLELRDAGGQEADDVPLYARRAVSPNNVNGGQDFQIVIGANSDGADRLAVGPAGADYGDIEERFIVRTDGVVAAGQQIPGNLQTNDVLFCQPDGVTLALATNGGEPARVSFQTLPALTETAHLAYDDATSKLRISVGNDLANATTFSSTGHVGIRMDDPIIAHVDANDLVIQNPSANVGLTLLSQPTTTGNIHFADGLTQVSETRAGFLRYNHNNNSMHLGTLNAVQATIDAQGDLGLGTETPNARIDVREDGSGLALKVNAGSIRAEDGGAATRLELQSSGGGLRVHGGITSSSRVAVTSDGRLGVGTDTPTSAVHVAKTDPDLRLDATGGGNHVSVEFAVSGAVRSAIEYFDTSQRTVLTNAGNVALTLRDNRVGVNLGTASPTANLHVRGNISADAGNTASHVALIENEGGSNADVLALRLSNVSAGGSNNFVTFFDSTGAIGRIERSSTTTTNPGSAGTFLRLISGGADFAECLPRAQAGEIGPGRIVGVRNGRVSLSTAGAEALLATTDRAVVVGNMAVDAVDAVETVALVGQVKLAVEGPVQSGDFIVPSGQDDGIGRAVSPGSLSPDEVTRVVGRAWQDRPADDRSPVTVAVGIQGSDATAALGCLLTVQQQKIEALQASLDAMSRRLAESAG